MERGVNVGADMGCQAQFLVGAGVGGVSLDGLGLHADEPGHKTDTFAAQR